MIRSKRALPSGAKGRPDAGKRHRPGHRGHVLARHVQRVSRNIHRGDIGVGEGVGREDGEATRPGTEVKHTGDAGRVVDGVMQSIQRAARRCGIAGSARSSTTQSHLLGETEHVNRWYAIRTRLRRALKTCLRSLLVSAKSIWSKLSSGKSSAPSTRNSASARHRRCSAEFCVGPDQTTHRKPPPVANAHQFPGGAASGNSSWRSAPSCLAFGSG